MQKEFILSNLAAVSLINLLISLVTRIPELLLFRHVKSSKVWEGTPRVFKRIMWCYSLLFRKKHKIIVSITRSYKKPLNEFAVRATVHLNNL